MASLAWKIELPPCGKVVCRLEEFDHKIAGQERQGNCRKSGNHLGEEKARASLLFLQSPVPSLVLNRHAKYTAA
jgi:hypothetical protein